MHVFHTKKDLIDHLSLCRNDEGTIGFVPTMGALHVGHISLVNKSLKENTHTVVSVFVNPTQFNNSSDLKAYPRTLEKDIELLKKKSEAILVFSPTPEDLYDGAPSSVAYNFEGLESQMEGKFRPGHFDGVGTVVKLLLNCVMPNHAYFGEKDFQQLQIIKKLVELEKLPVKVVGCPIYRESNGLAFSSRNERLTTLQRAEATLLFKVLESVKKEFGTKSVDSINEMVRRKFENHGLFELEYFEIAAVNDLKTVKTIESNTKYRAFLAVFADQVRLIDNIALN